MLSGHHRRALLRASTDGPANLKVQFRLRQFGLQQGVQGLVIPFIPEPHAAEVSQLEYHIFLGELLALREVFRAEPLKIPVGVACSEDLHAVIHLLFG